MPNLLLAGYFGCGNLGDDAILAGFTDAIDREGVEVTVMSGFPEETYRTYGVRAVPRKDLKAVQAAIQECDALVFPGGSIFQDVTSVKSAGYYSNLVSRAKSAKKRVALLGQGVGPLTTFFGKRFAVSAFNDADVVVVRDPASAQTLKELGVKRPVQVAADMAFLMRLREEGRDSAGFAVGNMKTIGMAPRPWGKETKNIIKLFGELSRMMYQSNYMPVLIEMDQASDRDLIAEIGKTQGGKVPDLRRMSSPMQVQERISRMEAVIGMRLHAGILAASSGVLPFMVSYDPKVNAFSKLMGMPPPLPIAGLNATRLFESFQSFMKDAERHRKVVAKHRDEQVKLAELNIEALKTCLRDSGVTR